MSEIVFFKFCYSVFKRSLIFICIVSISTVIFTYFFSISQPKQYTAETSILFVNTSGSLGVLSGISSSLGVGVGAAGGIDGNTIKQLFESRTLREAVVSALELDKYYNKSFIESVERLKGDVRIINYEIRKILLIHATMSDPRMAAQVANTYVDKLKELNQRLKLSTEREIVTVLDPATVPLQHSGPFVKKNMTSAFVSAFFLSYLLAFCWFEFLRKDH